MKREAFTTSVEDGFTCGPWRAPVNIASAAAGTIHEDATAQKLGLRGGTIAGSIHMEQFAPLALALFGEDWFAHGALSLYFQHATLDGERVRARAESVARAEGLLRARVDMIDANGAIVCAGTAGCGRADPDSEMRQRLASVRETRGDLRMLADARVGDEVADVAIAMPSARLDAHLPTLTERLAIYTTGPKRALPANLAIDVMSAVASPLIHVRGDFVGLYGGIELRFINGPIRADTIYVAEGRVLALGETPRTEIVWYESLLRDESGAEIAHMIMLTRLMKASSALWRET
jgi:hypothetical protein